MAKREIDILLTARNEASAEIKRVKGDLESIGGTKLSGLVGAWKNISAYGETLKAALVPVAAIGAMARGDWKAVDQSMSRLPKGLGEVYQLTKMVAGELTGWNAELREMEATQKRLKVEISALDFFGDLMRENQRQLALIGKEGMDRQILQIEQGYEKMIERIKAKAADAPTSAYARNAIQDARKLADAQIAEARRKDAEKRAGEVKAAQEQGRAKELAEQRGRAVARASYGLGNVTESRFLGDSVGTRIVEAAREQVRLLGNLPAVVSQLRSLNGKIAANSSETVRIPT